MIEPELIVSPKSQKANYSVYIGQDIFSAELIAPYLIDKSVLVICDAVVHQQHFMPVWVALTSLNISLLDFFILPPGEHYKILNSFTAIIENLMDKQFTRDTVIIALGGGVVGDIAGFVAACYQRGIEYIQCPTTLLAQVDAAIGGKTGINHHHTKNIIGAFYQPRLVLCELNWLSTLSERDYRAGLAEVIKYGLILDEAFFDWIQIHQLAILARDMPLLKEMVTRALRHKASLIQEDTLDQNRRALLNFGHTLGHALESLTDYTSLLHGEAVAIGMVAALYLSHSVLGFPMVQVIKIKNSLTMFGLPVRIPPGSAITGIFRHLYKDKKRRENGQPWILLKSVGSAEIVSCIPDAKIRMILQTLGGV
jgi:3-dehydroquinate synthase